MFKPLTDKVENILIEYGDLPKKYKDCIGLMTPVELNPGKKKSIPGARIIVKRSLRGYAKFGVVNHEIIHVLCPNFTEKEVIKSANMLTSLLWLEGYRQKPKGKNKK